MNLFQKQNIKLHLGQQSNFKIECDALTNEDLECLAYLISRKIKFSHVYRVPRGGTRLQEFLIPYRDMDSSHPEMILIVDDVLTTGGSMKRFKEELGFKTDQIKGVALFSRMPRNLIPEWIRPVFYMDELFSCDFNYI